MRQGGRPTGPGTCGSCGATGQGGVFRDECEDVTGPPCPWCGTPNLPGRHFCRRCAMSQKSESPEQRRSWWHRVLDRDGNEIPYAGQRPRTLRRPGQLANTLVAAAIAVLVIAAVIIWGPTSVTNIEDHFAQPVWRPASALTASSQNQALHPASKSDDRLNDTWWSDGIPGNGKGQWLQAGFKTPLDLLDIIVTPGASVTRSTFAQQASPHVIGLTLTDTGGKKTSQQITLADGPGPQAFSVHGTGIVSIRFTIVSSYVAQAEQSPNPEVAITEVEFFSK